MTAKTTRPATTTTTTAAKDAPAKSAPAKSATVKPSASGPAKPAPTKAVPAMAPAAKSGAKTAPAKPATGKSAPAKPAPVKAAPAKAARPATASAKPTATSKPPTKAGKSTAKGLPPVTLEELRAVLAEASKETTPADEAGEKITTAVAMSATYGITRAVGAHTDGRSDQFEDRIIEVHAPWARIKAGLLCRLATAMRCRAVVIAWQPMTKVHVVGFRSDLERLELVYAALLAQLDKGLAKRAFSGPRNKARLERQDWLLGFVAATLEVVTAVEDGIVTVDAKQVVAARKAHVIKAFEGAYPKPSPLRMTSNGTEHDLGHIFKTRTPVRVTAAASSR